MTYESKLKSKEMDHLFEAILKLKTVEECYRFFDDLCTIGELQALSQRLEVAIQLSKGITYHEIAEDTGASTATISRINKCLTYGAEGYQLILDRMK